MKNFFNSGFVCHTGDTEEKKKQKKKHRKEKKEKKQEKKRQKKKHRKEKKEIERVTFIRTSWNRMIRSLKVYTSPPRMAKATKTPIEKFHEPFRTSHSTHPLKWF